MQFSYATNSNAMQPMYKTNVSNITHMHFSLLSSAYSQVKYPTKNLVLSFSMSMKEGDKHRNSPSKTRTDIHYVLRVNVTIDV